MALSAVFLGLFWTLPSGAASGAALCAVGFCLYGPQALTGVAATNLCGKQFAGTSIGFISLFSYIGVSISGKVCGTLAQSTGGWQVPVWVVAGTAAAGMVFFLTLWRAKAHNYGS
jgi:OPA family glycerol-3-phosphate transporter-like MFS transporter/OPA family sugar phosphate sensor protein UhpC-like MFS transporter